MQYLIFAIFVALFLFLPAVVRAETVTLTGTWKQDLPPDEGEVVVNLTQIPGSWKYTGTAQLFLNGRKSAPDCPNKFQIVGEKSGTGYTFTSGPPTETAVCEKKGGRLTFVADKVLGTEDHPKYEGRFSFSISTPLGVLPVRSGTFSVTE